VTIPVIPNQIFGVDLASVNPQLSPLIGLPLQPFNTKKGESLSENYTADIFGDVTVTFFDKLELGIGLRGSWEEIKGTLEVGEAQTPSPIGALTGAGVNIAFIATEGGRKVE